MDFNNMKLFANHHLRKEMPTIKYYSTDGNLSKSFKTQIDDIPSHLINLGSIGVSSTKSFIKQNYQLKAQDEKVVLPAMFSLKNIYFETFVPKNSYQTSNKNITQLNLVNTNMHLFASVQKSNTIFESTNLNNINYTNSNQIQTNNNTVHLVNNQTSHSMTKTNQESPKTVISTTNGIDSGKQEKSPKRMADNFKSKHTKSPNSLYYYRNLIEEISANRKSAKMTQTNNEKDSRNVQFFNEVEPEVGNKELDSYSNAQLSVNYQIIELNNLFSYEVRFAEAKKPKKLSKKKRFRPNSIDSDNGKNKCMPESKILNLQNEFNVIDNFDNNTSSDCDSEDSYIFFENDSIRKSNSEEESSTSSMDIVDKDDNSCDPNKIEDLDCEYGRSRLLSDCESEDSFVVFDEAENDQELNYLWDEESGEESDVDEPDCSLVLTQCWRGSNTNLKTKKVQFKPESELCTIHPMTKWSFAYQNARKGPWEQAARDRSRFEFKIHQINDVLKPILTSEHRDRMYRERFLQNDT